MDTELPPNWDWVTAAAGCSGAKFFESLYLGALTNIAKRMELHPPQDSTRALFKTSRHDDVFSVFSEASSGPVVRFVLRGRDISIEEHGAVNFSGTVTLDDKGRCRLRVGIEELDEWQVLKRALEILLFG